MPRQLGPFTATSRIPSMSDSDADARATPFISSLAHHAADPFRLLVEAVVDYAIFMLDPAGSVASWNPGAERIYGYKATQIIGQPVSLLSAGEDAGPADTVRRLQSVLQHGRHERECRCSRADGSLFWAVVITTSLRDPFDRHVGFAQVTRDVTERKTLIHALGERVKELSCLHAAAGILQNDRLSTADWLRELVGLIPPAWQYPQDTAGRIAVGDLEFTSPGFIPTPWMQRAEFTCADGVKGAVEVVYLTEKPPEVEGPFLVEERRLIDSLADLLRSEIDRRKAEEARRQSEAELLETKAFLDTLIDSLPATLVLIDPNQRFRRWNKGLEQATGYTGEEISRLEPLALIVPDDRPAITKAIEQVFSTGHTAIESHFLTRDGKEIPYYFKGVQLVTKEGPWILVFGIDLSERRRLEGQFRQAQKMEAVGTLAGGVAHDFNNLLTIISGYGEMLLSDLAPTDPARELVAEIHEAAERATGLTRQLLAFSRHTVLDPRVVNLNDLVRENEKMLRRLIGEDVELTAVLDPALAPVRVDPGQIGQVIMNLAVNARDAMPTGGKLTIETATAQLDDTFAVAQPEARPGRYVLLSVTDTGSGMSPAVQAHIFEPFFTTKGPGKGTGLGLATVYGIVKQSGGFVVVHTELGHGARFTCYFPVAEDRAAADESARPVTPAATEVAARGTETILLVEDEDALRSIVRLALQRCGYTVLEASQGTAALRLAEQHEGPLHLLITDVVMPVLGGRELVERIARLRPDIKILYLSGYTDDAVVRHGVLQADVAFLQKPFTMVALANKVRQILGG
jgi:PAS domain S-box-containing protein